MFIYFTSPKSTKLGAVGIENYVRKKAKISISVESWSFPGIDNFRRIDDFRGVLDYSDEFTPEKNFVENTHEPSKTEKSSTNVSTLSS